MPFPKTSLYAKDQTGSIRVWSIRQEGQLIIMEHGKLNGQMSESHEHVEEGLASRTLQEQIESRINSRISNKLDGGYVRDIETARTQERVNALGYKKPMLAKVYENVIDKINFRSGVFIQPKYNGNRCLIRNEGGTLISYSRKGKINNRLDHLLDKIDIPVGTTLDGELYCHGIALQTINSWVKRLQVNTKKINFMCYDVILNTDYTARYDWLDAQDFWCDEIRLTPNIMVTKPDQVKYYLNEFRRLKYEGAMLRQKGFPYEDGKRSLSLIKVKAFEDAEFLVVDIEPSGEGWAILWCITKDGKRFKASAPGEIYEKRRIMKEKDKYIGRYIKIEYSELTERGVPSQPVALCWIDEAVN